MLDHTDDNKVIEDIRPYEQAVRLIVKHAPPMQPSRTTSRVSATQLGRRALAVLFATTGATVAATALATSGLVTLSSAGATGTVLYASPTA